MSKPTPPRRTKKRLAIALVSLALSLGAAELAVRGLDMAPEFYPVQSGRFRLAENPRIDPLQFVHATLLSVREEPIGPNHSAQLSLFLCPSSIKASHSLR